MQYRTMEQIAAEADILLASDLSSRRARLERWAEVLESRPARRLRAIPDIEYGSRQERGERHIDGSPLAVAYADPVLRVAGLRGDRLGDAAEFFGLSYGQLHRLLCVCSHGQTIAASTMAAQLRALAGRAEGSTIPVLGLAVGVAGAALAAGLALTAGLF